MALIIQGGTIVTSAESFRADIRVENEKIIEIGMDLNAESNSEVIDAKGKLVLPGGVDTHVHLDLPMFGTISSDDHYTGMKAAAFGGTTTVIDFVSQGESPLKANIDLWHQKADSKAAVDFGFHMNITHLDEQVEKEIPLLGTEGITSIKVFTAYNGRLRLQDGDIFKVLRIASRVGILTLLHAENGDIIDILVKEALRSGHTTPGWHARTRPGWGAVESVARGIALAAMAEAPLYIVHMNMAGEVDQLEYGRQKHLPIMGETCPQYLFFTEEELEKPDGAKWVCSPPLRSHQDNQRLKEGLQTGIIQTLSTDHCPFFFDGTKPIIYEGKPIAIPGKELGEDDFTKIPNGLPGVGDRLPVFWTKMVGTGKITNNQFVEITSTNPARIFGLYPKKGTLEPGSDADIAIWDPGKKVKYGKDLAQHRTDYNLYEGWDLTGFPEKVLLRGKVIVDGKNWLGHAGMGRFIPRHSFTRII
jgi:dihydropyrimidinase